MTTFSNDDFATLLMDILEAEALPIPGIARHHYVVARQIGRACASPPPAWIWILVKALDYIIPVILQAIKDKYGDEWPTKLGQALLDKVTPWSS
jgi:hypothetical protein